MSDQQQPGSKEPAAPSFDNEMAEIIESFFVETNEILEKLSQDLLELEKHPANAELHNTVFRAVHTVKGTSSFLGFDQMTELAHHFEDVLNKIRKNELAVTREIMDVMMEAYDVLKLVFQRAEARNQEPVDLSAILEKLDAVAQGTRAAATVVTAPEAPKEREVTKEAAAAPMSSNAQAVAAGSAKVVESTIRVDVARLDSLMNLVGELVLARNRLSQMAFQVNTQYEDVPISKELTDTSSQIDYITTELQMAVMKTRMVPVAKVFNKLPRLVRDLCRDMEKEIDLQIFGEETELDKTIIEELNDPLVHILRNAADHGIETPDARRKAGKPSRGVVIVKAEHEGNHIVISIQDDGKGMDPDKLKGKGVEKGLITEAQAREMSDRDAFNLIFAPGFSTAQKVTNVSGRGVGMDVVRTNITKLKGIIDIESKIGAGSKFIIKLPLTLAIIQGLLVEGGKEIFCVPLGSVLEVVRAQAKDIQTIQRREVLRLRDTVLPLARISSVMQAHTNGKSTEWLYIVVVGLADQRLGIVVDSLLGQKEVVIKTLGAYLGSVPGVAGSTILGDGRVIMIIDVGQFMKLCGVRMRS